MTIFHVAMGFGGPATEIATIQDAFPGGAGWARYAPNCWIVNTHVSANDLADKIRAVCRPQDSVFVCELNLNNNSGVLQKEIWDWINNNSAKSW
jgi:hypothetical protein